MNTTIRILLVDDHAIVREGLRTMLVEEPGLEVAAEAATGAEAVALAASLRPDVVLMDVVMPDGDGIQALRQIRQANPQSRVLMLTSFVDEQKVREAIQAGATGYLLKDVLKAELLRAIRAAARDEPTLHPEAQRQLIRQVLHPQEPSLLDALTARESQVLRRIAQGCSNKEIAAILGLTEGTVKGYVSAILVKIGAADRTQAALMAVKAGILGED